MSESAVLSHDGCIPSKSLVDIIHHTISESVEGIASAIIAKTSTASPSQPDASLRPISNQLMATNANLSQVAALMGKLEDQHKEMSNFRETFSNQITSVQMEVQRMNRAASKLTEAAEKVAIAVNSFSSSSNAVVQGVIDSNHQLSQALSCQADAFKSLHTQIRGIIEDDRRHSQVGGLVAKVLKIDEGKKERTLLRPS